MRPVCPERFEGELAERTGVILGTGLGGVGTLIDGFNTNITRGPDRISPFLIPMGIPNIGSGQIAIQFGMTGPNFTTVSACATGGHALGESSEIIRRGDADVMIAGGAEAGIYEPMVGGFAAMRALSTRNDDPEGASRPFDMGRDGFVIGEGAGVVVLEELEHAEARGATILAELVGYGATADASHITLPGPRRYRRGAGSPDRPHEGRARTGRDRPRQCSRDLDAGRRQVRAAGDPDDLRRPRAEAVDHGQQVDAGAHARCSGRHRGDHHGPDDAARLRPADDQPR